MKHPRLRSEKVITTTFRPYLLRDKKSRSKKENCIFRSGFFDLAFLIATSHRNGGESRSEKMEIEKYCATRYRGLCMAISQKPKENARGTASHKPEHTGSDYKGTQEHSKA